MKFILPKKWKLFPSPETVAYFHTLGLYIVLNKLSEKHYSELKKNPFQYDLTHIKTVHHEIRHWEDYIATLWGQKKLIKIFNAYSARFSGNERNFSLMKEAASEFRLDSFFDYYQEIYNHIVGSTFKRWKWELSTGIRFDHLGRPVPEKPIMFIRFKSNEGVPISREPVSIATLLETNAINQEISIHIAYAKTLPAKKQAEEILKLDSELFKWLYDPEMCLYSVAAHLTANILHFDRAIEAFRFSSALSTLCLNFPDQLFDSIPIPTDFSETWGERNNWFLKNRDRGYLFTILLKNYATVTSKAEKKTIDKLLEASRLPNLEEISKLVVSEFASFRNELFPGIAINRLIDELRKGNALFTKRGILGKNYFTDLNQPELPEIVFNDTYFDTDFDIEELQSKFAMAQTLTFPEWFTLVGFLEKKIDEFELICGV